MKTLLIDNYDSFTYNLYHYLLSLKCNVEVVRKENEQITILSTNKFFDKKTLVKEPKIGNLSDGEIVEIDIPDSKKNSKVIINNALKSHGPSNRNDLFTFLAKKEFSWEKLKDTKVNDAAVIELKNDAQLSPTVKIRGKVNVF